MYIYHLFINTTVNMLKHLFGILLLSFVTSFQHGQRILLSDVKALSLQSGKYTTGYRTPPVPQLNCESGFCSYGPNNIMCENVGHGDTDFVWKCTGYGMTPGYKLRNSDVSCEGYEFKEDPYVLAGSCAVYYSVDKDYSYTKPVTTTTTTSTPV